MNHDQFCLGWFLYLLRTLFLCRPVPLSVGFFAQYVLKPLLGVLVANAFGMPRTFYAGFVLTCCVAGAQLSSYASSLSKADVAMSILLTSSTTIASVLFTPLLSGLLIGSVVPVDAVAMSKSILQVTRFRNMIVKNLSSFAFEIQRALLSVGGACSSHSWPCVKYLCKACGHSSSTCDAVCCYGMHFIVHWKPTFDKSQSDSVS